MYQYFPHKQALLYALNERYLDLVAERVEKACRQHHGATTRAMVEALITVYWDAQRTERSDVTRALYSSAVELDNEALIEAFAKRMDAATAEMLASAPDAHYADIALVNVTMLSVIFGTVRNVFERNLPEPVQGRHSPPADHDVPVLPGNLRGLIFWRWRCGIKVLPSRREAAHLDASACTRSAGLTGQRRPSARMAI